MEGKEEIIETILSSARTAAENVVSDAKAERDSLVAATVEQVDRESARRLQTAHDDAAGIVARRVKLAELDGRKVILAAKQEVIEKAYAQAVTKLLNMTDNVYREFIGNIVCSCAERGDELVIAERDAKRLHHDWLDALNKKSGLCLTMATFYHNGRGGVVLSNARCDKNLTIETLVEEVRARTEKEVAEKLFR